MASLAGLARSLLALMLLAAVVGVAHSANSTNSNNSANSRKISARIVGGVATTISKYKYLVNLRNGGSFSCGGSLVAPRFVVTAAHCVKGVKRSRLTVHGGISNLSKKGVWRKVAKVILPKSFSYRTMTMDVAVLKLKKAMKGPNISTIGLCTRTLKVGRTVRVSGWGLTKASNKRVPKQVRTVQVKMFSKSNCQKRYKGQASLTKTMVCASVLGRKDSCSGDSGGPLVYKGQLCGIVSWGIGCASKKYPGVYTAVNTVKTFIKQALKK